MRAQRCHDACHDAPSSPRPHTTANSSKVQLPLPPNFCCNTADTRWPCRTPHHLLPLPTQTAQRLSSQTFQLSHLTKLAMHTSFSPCLKVSKSFWPLSFLACWAICMMEKHAFSSVSNCSSHLLRLTFRSSLSSRYLRILFGPHHFRPSSTELPWLSSSFANEELCCGNGVFIPLSGHGGAFALPLFLHSLRLANRFATFLATPPSFLGAPTNGSCLPLSGQFSRLC